MSSLTNAQFECDPPLDLQVTYFDPNYAPKSEADKNKDLIAAMSKHISFLESENKGLKEAIYLKTTTSTSDEVLFFPDAVEEIKKSEILTLTIPYSRSSERTFVSFHIPKWVLKFNLPQSYISPIESVSWVKDDASFYSCETVALVVYLLKEEAGAVSKIYYESFRNKLERFNIDLHKKILMEVLDLCKRYKYEAIHKKCVSYIEFTHLNNFEALKKFYEEIITFSIKDQFNNLWIKALGVYAAHSFKQWNEVIEFIEKLTIEDIIKKNSILLNYAFIQTLKIYFLKQNEYDSETTPLSIKSLLILCSHHGFFIGFSAKNEMFKNHDMTGLLEALFIKKEGYKPQKFADYLGKDYGSFYEYYLDAKNLFRNSRKKFINDYEPALLKINSALNIFPKNISAIYLKAKILLSQNKFIEAYQEITYLQNFSDLCADVEDNQKIINLKIQYYILTENYEKASHEFFYIKTGSISSLIWKALLDLKMNNYNDSLKNINFLLQNDRSLYFPKVGYMQAVCLFIYYKNLKKEDLSIHQNQAKMGDLAREICGILEELVILNPYHVHALTLWGDLFFELKSYKEAYDKYQHAVVVNPSNETAQKKIKKCASFLGNF